MASGECDYQYHGANRLGANSLLSAAYSGTVSGPEAMKWARSGKNGSELTYEEMEAARAEVQREYDKIFPLGASISPWVGMVSYSLWGFLFDATQSYTIMLLAGLACSVITAVTGILAMSASKKLPRETAEIER